MRVLDLFAGIGGFSLGLDRAGIKTVGFCEIEPFCRRVLNKNWPDVYIHDDIRTLTTNIIQRECGDIDIVAGGFPCQPHSVAGKRQGVSDERYLWPDMFRVISEVKPRWVVIENVIGIRTTATDQVLADLESASYTAWPLVVGAWAVGAPHRRDRVWIVANANGNGQSQSQRSLEEFRQRIKHGSEELGNTAGVGSERAGAEERRASLRFENSGSNLADTISARLERSRNGTGSAGSQVAESAGSSFYRWPARPGQQQHEWEEPRTIELPLGGSVNGVSTRLVRRLGRNALKALGNAVVPQCAEVIGKAIMSTEIGDINAR